MTEYRNVDRPRAIMGRAVQSIIGPCKLPVVILISVGIFLCGGPPARAEGVAYNSSRCTNNPHGMIYVAAGRHVYHQPFENLQYVHGVSFETAAGLSVSPTLSEPEGCPDHPLRGMGFKFGPFSDVTKPKAAEPAMGGFVQLIEIDRTSWWDTHELYALAKSGTCAAGEWQGVETTPGLTVCPATAASSAGRGSRSPFFAIVDPRLYKGPLGQQLAVFCNPNTSAHAEDYSCEISYRLDEHVGVWYDFRTSLVPLSGLIAFDRELRRRIGESEVPAHLWPVPPSAGRLFHINAEPR
jgi:hypothetical protein